jgi:carboxymethylenebutenolidase
MTAEAKKIDIAALDGHRLSAWRCEPAGRPTRGGIVILHAVYGLTEHMGAVCERWAAAGYTAVAPALFDRLGPDIVHSYSAGRAGTECYNALTQDQIFADIRAAADAAGGLKRVAISGFCTGGTWAWKAGAALPFPLQVNFYGSAIHANLDLKPLSPIILHFGTQDHVVSTDRIELIHKHHPQVQLHLYAGVGHAFENVEQSTFDKDASDLAWARSIAFMDAYFVQ